MGFLISSCSVGHQVERGKRQKGRQKALYVTHECGWRGLSERLTLMNQFNFISKYKAYIPWGSWGTSIFTLSVMILSQA